MPRIELQQIEDEAVLRVDSETRQRLAGVLGDWLSVYAGVQPVALKQADFDLVVEMRRVLLAPDEVPVPSA
jgi:hypothetical protein